MLLLRAEIRSLCFSWLFACTCEMGRESLKDLIAWFYIAAVFADVRDRVKHAKEHLPP